MQVAIYFLMQRPAFENGCQDRPAWANQSSPTPSRLFLPMFLLLPQRWDKGIFVHPMSRASDASDCSDQPSVDKDRLTIDIACAVGQQEGDCFPQFLYLAVSS